MNTILKALALLAFSAPNLLFAGSKQLSESDLVVFEAVTYWCDNYRNKDHSYTWVEDDKFITTAVKKKLRNQIREFQNEEKGTFFNLNITDVQFPVDGFAFIEIIDGNPFSQIKYVQVLEKKKDWKVIDNFDLASGLIESIGTTFNWEKYYKDLRKQRSKQLVETTETSSASP